MITELAKDLYWVGVVDWGLRHFHGHELSTPRGSSYNSYLILDEKKVLVDTVWDPFSEDFVEKLAQIIDPAKLDYIICNHMETDHSGALPTLMRLCPNATIIVSKRGLSSLKGHYHANCANWKVQAVGTGDTLKIGKRELLFFEAPMCHWPDTMFTYIMGEGVLMPNDAFGQHYATGYRWNDQVDQEELFAEALKYYANILAPFSKQVLTKIDELLALKLPVNMILPSHGVLWRKDPLQIVTKYQQWARQEPEKSAVILYDTMWNATRQMAEAIGDGLAEAGVPYKLLHMAVTDRNEAIVEVFKAKAILIGSSTHNNGLLPSIMPILEDLKGLKLINKIGGAFGSYGWSGESNKQIEEHLAKCKIPLAAPSVKALWQPTPDDLEKCREMGRQVAKAINA